MKRIAFYTVLCALFSLTSCQMFEIDNYDAPGETIEGEVVDVLTGEPVLTDQGSEGIRVRLKELSWKGGTTITDNPDFWCKPDGTFRNTKIFKGTYNIRIDGPFIPLVRDDANGVPLAPYETITKEIKGVTKVKFEVQPFLKVEVVGEPTASNGKITAQVRVTRAVSVDEFRSKIEPMGGYNTNFTDVTDIQLFASYSSSVGYRARDNRWTNSLTYSGSSFNSQLGQIITISTIGDIPSGRTIFVRAAARINYATAGVKRYNYSEAYEVVIP